MAEIIIKTKQGEVIPQISPEAFGLAVQSMEDLDAQMKDLELKARELPKVFDSRTQYELAANLIVQKKSLVKLGEAVMTPYAELIKKVKTFIDQQKNIVSNHGEIVTGILTPAMIEFDEREKRAKDAEEKRLQAEKEERLKRENEEKAQKDAEAAAKLKKERIEHIREDLKRKKITLRQSQILLTAAGADAEAALAKIAADKEDADANAVEEAAKLKLKPNTATVAGIIRRTNRKFKVVDARLVKINFLKPDEVAIGEVVRDKTKSIAEVEKEVGGIEVYEDKTF
jgi:hypothetical protein